MSYNLLIPIAMKQYEVDNPLRKISVVIEMESSLTPFRFYELLKSRVDDFEHLEDLYEKYNALFDDFDKNYFTYIWKNYESVNIDLCTMDKDYDCFREMLAPIEHLRDSSIDQRDELLKEYDPVVKRINKFYREVEHFMNVFNHFQKMNGSGNEGAQWN